MEKEKPLTQAAAANSLQSCPTVCDPKMAAHQAPLSLGFSRQEYWSGSPFPSPPLPKTVALLSTIINFSSTDVLSCD